MVTVELYGNSTGVVPPTQLQPLAAAPPTETIGTLVVPVTPFTVKLNELPVGAGDPANLQILISLGSAYSFVNVAIASFVGATVEGLTGVPMVNVIDRPVRLVPVDVSE